MNTQELATEVRCNETVVFRARLGMPEVLVTVWESALKPSSEAIADPVVGVFEAFLANTEKWSIAITVLEDDHDNLGLRILRTLEALRQRREDHLSLKRAAVTKRPSPQANA